ncbi:MAG: UPF0182 family protein [Candidatus Heimdallarchaeota archaeon]
MNKNEENKVSRFKYIPFKKKPKLKKIFLGLLIIFVILIILSIFWFWPAWIGPINLQVQLYETKANTNFIEVHFINFWGSNFFFNKTSLIGALTGCIIMSIPPDRTLLSIIGTRLGFGKPSYVKSLIFWWSFGFILFYLLGFMLNLNGQSFAWTAYLIENGEIQLSPNIIIDAFQVIFNQNNMDFITIFIYGTLILPLITLSLGIIIFRIVLNIAKNLYLRRNDFYVLANTLLICGLLFGLWFFFLPTQALNGINLIQIWSIIFAFVTFNAIGILIYVFGRLSYRKNSKNYILKRQTRKKIIVVGAVIVIFIIVPLMISIGPAISLNNTEVWVEQEWNKKIRREIDWTRECAGLSIFEERPVENFTESPITDDATIRSNIRQFDQDFAVQYLAASIGSTFEGLADSDIIYIRNPLTNQSSEYWVAPKTIRFSQITGDPVQTNTELYDHVEGFLAMDTFSGNLVNLNSTFNIPENYPIFFGESESKKFLEKTQGYYEEGSLGAYDSDILLGTEWAEGIPNNEFRYTGDPDGTLTGLEGFWKTINLGLIAYATQAVHEYLINRNVKTRVGNTLFPNLKIDSDPYLVFDINASKMYYAVSIYTHINIGSYAKFPILRFLGVCLIDVKTGELEFYRNPSLNTSNDPTYSLWRIYTSISRYNWQDAPDWLKEQIRYPEDLFELQLEANYIYHVQNPTTWRREDDFHERPANGDLFYIETDLGQGIEYVGLDLVEYKGRSAIVLAGMYVVRHGVHFGEAIFYTTRNSDKTLIGPKSANETYLSEATQEITLISGARNGNILLYPLGDSIYYYIPTYSTAGDLQQLKLVGFVEAFTRKVGYGSNVEIAYNNLNISTSIPSNISLSYEFNMEPLMTYPDDPAKFIIQLQNLDTNFSAPGLNIIVRLSVYTSTTSNVNYSLILPLVYSTTNTSFTIGEYSGINFTIIDKILYFGEGITLTGFLNTSKGNIIVYYKWTLIVNGDIIYESLVGLIYVYE